MEFFAYPRFNTIFSGFVPDFAAISILNSPIVSSEPHFTSTGEGSEFQADRLES